MKSIAYKTYINIGKHEFRVPDLNWNGTFNAGLSFEDVLTSIEESISDYLIANYYSKDIDPPARDSIIEKKPPKAIETYILVNTEMIESDKDALEEMDEYEKTRVFNQMNSNENVFEWMKNSDIISFTLCQKKMINRIKKIAEKNPEDARILIENEDGSVFGKMKRSCLRVQSPVARVLTEEEHNALVIRLAEARERMAANEKGRNS